MKSVNLQIEIVNNNGQKVYQSERLKRNQGIQDHQVDVSVFAPGIYMVMLKTNYGISAEKLVVGGE